MKYSWLKIIGITFALLLFTVLTLVSPGLSVTATAPVSGGVSGGTGDPIYIFSGRGRAHGVGLCMDGVLYRAQAGWGYRDIINYYYTGVTWSSVNESQPIRVKCRDGQIRTYTLHDYLYHLQEEPESYPAEGLKVLYVAARTYVLSCIARGKHAKDGYDICSSGNCCQAFDENKDLAKYPNNRRAVDATSGQVLMYNGSVITAAYSGSCGGHTENNEDVWGGKAIPYLRGKPDDFCQYSSRYAWQAQFKKSEVEARLNSRADTAIGQLYAMDLSNRTPGGRVRVARLVGSAGEKQVSGSVIQSLFGLQSTLFELLTSNFDEYLLVLNPNKESTLVTFTLMRPDGQTQDIIQEVAGNSRYTMKVNDYMQFQEVSSRIVADRPVIAERSMYFNYGGAWTGGHDVMGTTSAQVAWYFAEGTCRPNFDPFICVQNPGDTDANVTITYMKGDGTTESQDFTVIAHARSTVRVVDKLGIGDDAAHDFSSKVECTNGQGIIAERPMYFNYKGAWTGGHDVIGTTSPQEAWYFAEGTCRPNFDPYICIQNPGDKSARVKITFMKGDGTAPTQDVNVPSHARYTVRVKDKLGEADDSAHDFSSKVECTNGQQIIAERPMYFNYQGYTQLSWTGGHDVIGTSSPQEAWYFAEGTCRPNFDPYICIQNPGEAAAKVKITYFKGDATTVAQDVNVPAHARYTVRVKDKLGEGDDAAHDFSSKVECTNGQQIIAERPMYFNYQGYYWLNWTGGHDVIGVTEPSSVWYFAEGYTGF